MLGKLAFVVACAACGSPAAYVCTASDQCVDHGVQGVCSTAGYCSFPDPECPSGQRYEPKAGGGLGGSCVPDDQVPPDGPSSDTTPATCGAVGQACCALEQGNPCVDNAFCDTGTSTCATCMTGVAMGGFETCFLRYDHTLWCAGRNFSGQLGNNMSTNAPSAALVQVKDLAAGPVTDATAIESGFAFACAIRTGGAVSCWGDNGDGQLGDNTVSDRHGAVPVKLESSGQPIAGIVQLAATDNSMCGLDGNGQVFCWGRNTGGQLGIGDVTVHHAAVPVTGGLVATAIFGGGGAHTCAQTAANAIFCWGENGSGQVGDGTYTDVLAPAHVFDAPAISVGRFHTCAVKADSTVWCWGSNKHNRLGIVTLDSGDSTPDPMPVTGADGSAFHAATVSIAAMSCAVTDAKEAYCWGDDVYGQTGTGVGSRYPQRVLDGHGGGLGGIDHLVARYPHVCSFQTDGRILCWGRNAGGELLDSTLENMGFPTAMKLSCP